MGGDIERRDLLKGVGALAGAALLGPRLAGLFGGTSAEATALRGFAGESLLSLPAKESPIDHIVVLMMENRSFDHYLGWLGTDEEYVDGGRRRYGDHFVVDADQTQSFRDPNGNIVRTYHLPSKPGETNPYRGCDHPDPGHGWRSGRAQRDRGFLAEGTGNDEFALGYFDAADIPVYAQLARRFTVFDRFHCSVLAATLPNRHYLHCAQSGNITGNDAPTSPTGFEWPTIWEKLRDAAVSAAHYSVDVPSIGLYGARMLPFVRRLEAYLADCAAGTLPQVTFLDPGFTTGLRTDDHPYADIRAGQKYVFDVFKAFAESPHWHRGLFVITYDEWGGFFDHVAPPTLPDDRASSRDLQNFGQAGFRVPTMIASPFARRGFVDHRLYDHTSIMRFIQWRFLGAPPEGGRGSGWYLSKRDRYARNLGWSLLADGPDPEIQLDALPKVPVSSVPCPGEELDGFPDADGIPSTVPDHEKHAFELALEDGVFERLGFDIDLKPLPI